MGTIMRGDQTLQLIQKYYSYYPEIAKNTQDADGRRARSQMWLKITEELNRSYETNFSVEQYKKKIQNVQCTSRQKLQSGKRNLGVAEFEYLRLFEQDKLNGNSGTFGSDISTTRSSSTDLTVGIKMEQMLEQFGISLDTQSVSTNLTSDLQLGTHNQFEAQSASDSDSNSGEQSLPPTDKSPLMLAPPSANLMDPRQLILALSQLSQLNNEVHSSTLTPLIKTDYESVENNSLQAQQQIPSTLKRSAIFDREETENFTTKKKRSNGPNSSVEDVSWKQEMLKLQTQILDNQNKLLFQMARQSTGPDLSALENKLDQLCEAIGCLNATLKVGFTDSNNSVDSTSKTEQ
ncbi:hypothetical protein M3Y94_00128500 [Aphelenchoides besseyi]|nr:hypothetical protein M3Y94_00128500 [Aphelenchoides besseyi]KAI6237365.1 hypothetical protein M3Y95_00257200 [Aphelenchoides besseyi]